MKFKTKKSNNGIGVEDQDLVVKFCFAKKTQEDLYENMTYWSECRDFMGDAIMGMYDEEEKLIYGFEYDPKNKPLEMEYTCIGMRFPDKNTRDVFKMQLGWLDKYLIKNNLPNAFVCEQMVGSPLTLVLSLDKFWQQTTFNISYITFLLKSICWDLDGNKEFLDAIHESKHNGYPSKEAKYLDCNVKERLNKLMPKLNELTKQHLRPCGYTTKQEIYQVHNRSGFNYNCRWMPDNTVIGKWLKDNQ